MNHRHSYMEDSFRQQPSSEPSSDLILQLEKIAHLFLELLQQTEDQQHYASSILAVRKVAQFIFANTELCQLLSNKRYVLQREQGTQTDPDHDTLCKRGKETQNCLNNSYKGSSQYANKAQALCNTTEGGGLTTKSSHHSANFKVSANLPPERWSTHNSTGTNKNIKKSQVVGSSSAETNTNPSIRELETQRSKRNARTGSLTGRSNQDDNPHKARPVRHTHPPQSSSEIAGSSETRPKVCDKSSTDTQSLQQTLCSPPKCQLCGQYFQRKRQLEIHLRRKHSRRKCVRCDVCHAVFLNAPRLKVHCKAEHGLHDNVKLMCDLCGRLCSAAKDLSQHIQTHLATPAPLNEVVQTKKDGLFVCPVCGQSMSTRPALVAHMKRHLNAKEFQCEFCSKTFPNLLELKSHREQHASEEKPYKCPYCGKGFRNKTSLHTHKMLHTGEQPYTCDVCGKRFIQTSALNAHKLRHTAQEEAAKADDTEPSNNQYRCNICGRLYKSQLRLQLHMKSHDQTKDLRCQFCSKMFTSARELAIHQRIHVKGQLSCKVCHKSFKSRSEHYFHTKTHEPAESPHQCPESDCGKTFTTLTDLTTHQRRHKSGPDKEKPRDPFICTVCGKMYVGRSSLTIHMKMHDGVFDLLCDLCPKRFKTPAELRHHRRVHTKEKPYVCDICQRAFSRHSTLANHKRSHQAERPFVCMVCGASFKLKNTLKKHSNIHTREQKPAPKLDSTPVEGIDIDEPQTQEDPPDQEQLIHDYQGQTTPTPQLEQTLPQQEVTFETDRASPSPQFLLPAVPPPPPYPSSAAGLIISPQLAQGTQFMPGSLVQGQNLDQEMLEQEQWPLSPGEQMQRLLGISQSMKQMVEILGESSNDLDEPETQATFDVSQHAALQDQVDLPSQLSEQTKRLLGLTSPQLEAGMTSPPQLLDISAQPQPPPSLNSNLLQPDETLAGGDTSSETRFVQFPAQLRLTSQQPSLGLQQVLGSIDQPLFRLQTQLANQNTAGTAIFNPNTLLRSQTQLTNQNTAGSAIFSPNALLRPQTQLANQNTAGSAIFSPNALLRPQTQLANQNTAGTAIFSPNALLRPQTQTLLAPASLFLRPVESNNQSQGALLQTNLNQDSGLGDQLHLLHSAPATIPGLMSTSEGQTLVLLSTGNTVQFGDIPDESDPGQTLDVPSEEEEEEDVGQDVEEEEEEEEREATPNLLDLTNTTTYTYYYY